MAAHGSPSRSGAQLRVIRHILEGQTVLEYSHPQLDEGDANTRRLLEQLPQMPKLLSEGYICLQAESHPVEFRRVEIMRLADE